MHYDFDQIIDRRSSDSTKWHHFDADVLPLWTADMDFRVAEPIVQALHQRVDHGVFGYCIEPDELREVIVARMAELYQWKIEPGTIVFQTGVVSALHRVCRMAASTHDAILVQPPVYPPIATAARHNGSIHQENPLVRGPDGRYSIDFEAFEAAFTAHTRLLVLCNPHNPVGRVFSTAELSHMAEICLRHDVLICSDEIHCDLVFSGNRHVPIASLSPEVTRRTITLMAPSKTFNIPGLRCSFAIVQDPTLRARLGDPHAHDFSEVNSLGLAATTAAFKDGRDWLDQALAYLQKNRDLVVETVQRQMPGVHVAPPEATYLAWLDCRDSGISGNWSEFFRDRARVGLADGATFGTGGDGFIRLNFACPRSILTEALTRMTEAMRAAQS